jgi:hypothetical protein
MSMADFSPHQQGIIKRYYKHKDTLALQKLQELVTEIYLAESDKKREQLWKRIEKAMVNLEVPAARIQHILKERKAELLAENLKDWLR